MLRTSLSTSALFAFSLFTPACDDATDLQSDAELDTDEADDDILVGNDDPVCVPSPCPIIKPTNTNWVGTNPLDTVTQHSWNVATQLSNGRYMRFTGATCPAHAALSKFTATVGGELVFVKDPLGSGPSNYIQGEAVEGCKFHAQFADTASFTSPSSVDIEVRDAVPFVRADTTNGFKYLMTVVDLNTDLPPFNENHYPTCYDNADAPGNYYLHIRPGLALDSASWQLTADGTKQSWVCESGAFGHFGLKKVNVQAISDAALATTEGRAWGLYHHGASHTFVGNPIRIHHPTIAGYDPAPTACDETPWYREALWGAGGLLCRGSNATSWSDEINRNAFSHARDWDQDSSVAQVSVCSGSPSHDFETYAQCYMNGAIRVCPPSPC